MQYDQGNIKSYRWEEGRWRIQIDKDSPSRSAPEKWRLSIYRDQQPVRINRSFPDASAAMIAVYSRQTGDLRWDGRPDSDPMPPADEALWDYDN